MGFLRKLAALAIALAMAGIGVMFALQNPEPVPLDVLIVRRPPRSVALWVLSALALGGVLGMALSAPALLRLRARLAATRRQLNRAQSDVERLRAGEPALLD
jgi:uncharacterized integral membrane protein